jgi:hypothetical protein
VLIVAVRTHGKQWSQRVERQDLDIRR